MYYVVTNHVKPHANFQTYSMQVALWILATLMTGVSAKNMTVCDCTSAAMLGTIDFNDATECHLGTILQPNSRVSYTIFTSKEPQLKFKGFWCTAWSKEVTVNQYFFGSCDTIKSSKPYQLRDHECWRLHKTLNCFGHQLLATDNRWEFVEEPEPRARWMPEHTNKLTNCIIE